MGLFLNAINTVLTLFFDIVCWPFRGLQPIWALTLISFASGVFLVWLFGKTSNQDKIREVRNRIRGNLIGVRLFQHNISVVLRLQSRIFGDTFRFMKLAVVPMLIMVIPVILIMTQLNLRFAVRPTAAGEPVVVTTLVRDETTLEQPIALKAPEGVTVETPPVKIRSSREIAWRLRVDRPGTHTLLVQVGNDIVEKQIVGGVGWQSIVQRRSGSGIIDTLLYPGEPPIAANLNIEAIEVAYPPLELSLFGLRLDWLVGFLLLSMAFGFGFKGFLGVEV
jgi:uncharacterized membrane protein (DUF106 family)